MDGAYSLKQTDVEVTTARSADIEAVVGDVGTFTLPPLKLNFVDCCCANGNQYLCDDGWNLVKALCR
eukprot:5186127-Ditylum_brightwellii.AAC.1